MKLAAIISAIVVLVVVGLALGLRGSTTSHGGPVVTVGTVKTP